MRVASVKELNNQTSKLLKYAQEEDVIVTSRGKPIALISGLTDDDLEDYALISDPELKSRLEAGIKDADEGKLIPVEELIARAEVEQSDTLRLNHPLAHHTASPKKPGAP